MPHLSIERENGTENQQMLRRREPHHTRGDIASAEESTAGSARVVKAVLQAKNRTCLMKRDSVFDCAGHCLYCLRKAGPASITVPGHLRTNRGSPVLVKCPMRWQ